MSRLECWATDDPTTPAIILHPSSLPGGGWRLTWWDQVGPVSHREFLTREDACDDLRATIGPWPGVPELGLGPRPSAYYRVESAPWLGTTVITGGVQVE